MAAARAAPGDALEESHRLRSAVERAERAGDAAASAVALKAFVTHAEAQTRALEREAAEAASQLDDAGMALYRGGDIDLGLRAVEVGLALAPGSASLLHHKALLLIASNRSVDQALPLLEAALQANPLDKSTWATKGDALRILGRPGEAAEAYLKAQQLDPSSSQYVDRALKVVPDHPEALRRKVEIAQAHGGDRGALAALDALLASAPHDANLRRTKAEILDSLGEPGPALAVLDEAAATAPLDPPSALLRCRILWRSGARADAVAAIRALEAAPDDLVAGPGFIGLAELVGASDGEEGLAVDLRQRIARADPRNLANLIALRDIAMRTQRLETAAEACRQILAVSPENLDALRGLAELELTSGRIDAALEAYRALLVRHPTAVAEARRALEAALSAGRTAEVLEFSQMVLATEPGDAGAREQRAETFTREGDLPAALAEYDQWIAAAPGAIEPRLARKRLLVQLGATDRLPAAYDELFQLDPSRTDIALERGNLALGRAYEAAEGSEERTTAARTALVSYERALSDDVTKGSSQLGIARSARLLGDDARALSAYQEFLQGFGNDRRAEVHAELGHVLRDLGRLTEAEGEYARAIQLGLEDSDLLWNEIEVLTQLNQEVRAIRLVELLLQRQPENPLYLRRKGQILLKIGRRAEGLAALKVAVERAANDPHGLFEVAEALRAGGAYADSVAFYRQGLALDPKSRPGRLALAETLLLAGQYPEAIPAIDTLLKEDANDARAWKARADAFRAMGRPDEVLYSLKAILLLEPHNGAVLLEKARLHLDRQERREGLDCLSALARSGGPESQDGAVWLQVGDLAAELGETDEANGAYERAAQLDASHAPEIELRRARLRLAAGRPDLALEVLDASAPPAAGERPITAILLRAEILTALERPADAQRDYEEVRRREPKSPVAIVGLARSLLDQGRHADARALLNGIVPEMPPLEGLYLLLAEASAGIGDPAAATAALHKGVELLPKSSALWSRLGELAIAQKEWTDAATALGRAIALDPANVALLLRAGFVADRVGHPNEALAFYEHATEVAPADKDAWCARGLALLATGRPEEALRSFDRTLALDSDHAGAKDGRRAAIQRTREAQIEHVGREALLLEAKLNRPLTRNDLFVTLHAPFEFLDPVLAAIGRTPKIELDRLSEPELQDLENASYHLITAALERRPAGIERRGFTLADVAILTPPEYTLEKIQRLFGYLKAVLEAEIRPENLRLAPDVEELARRAIQLPEEQRSLFQIVRILRVGLYKARLIKAVEGAGETGHSPLPSLDLGKFSPEFRVPAGEPGEGPALAATQAAPRAPPKLSRAADPGGGHGGSAGKGHARSGGARGSAAVRCVGCGGLASLEHACGAALCRSCLATFRTCPKCQQAITPAALRALDGSELSASATTAGASSSPASHPRAHGSPTHPREDPPAHPIPPGAVAHEGPAHPPAASAPGGRGASHPPSAPTPKVAASGAPSPGPVHETAHASAAAADAPPPDRPPRPAHRSDEEPRL